MGVLDTASEFIGKVKYVFGASDPVGGQSDCSGFTKYVFKEQGINIGRTTQEQLTKGKEVPKSSAKPGDLIFFRNTYNSNYTAGVSHVGIVAGNGMMIDCGNSGVSLRSYETDYWKSHFLTVKRIDGIKIGAVNAPGVDNSTGSNSTDSTGSKANDVGLTWWGDVVVMIILILLIIASVILLMFALGIDKEVLPI